jgi:hypothetical protein
MHTRRAPRRFLVAASFLLCPLAVGAAAGQAGPSEDDRTVTKAGLRCDDESLLQFLRRRSLSDAKREEVRAWIRDLGSARFADRHKATRRLLALGPPVTPFLHRALADPDVEVVSRARRCLDTIRRGPGPELPAAVVRLLVRRRPPQTVETLLAYLPSAESDMVAEEVVQGLDRLSQRPGKIPPALRAALRARAAACRAAAAYMLGKRADAADRAEVRRLLRDPDAQVRLGAAHGLAAAKDPAAVAVLLALVKEGPDPPAGLADDLLRRIAGETAPDIVFAAGSAAERAAVGAAWESWWRRHGPRFDWRRVHVGLPGGALVAELETNSVWEAGGGGRARWAVDELGGPYDVQRLTGGRLLVAEFLAGRVTERDRQGKVLWQKSIADPVGCRRLPDGNTFIATTRRVVEFRPDGKEAYSYALKEEQVPAYSAYRPAASSAVYLACQEGLMLLDTRHAPVTAKKLPLDSVPSDVQPAAGGRLLVTAAWGQRAKVMELEADGRVFKEWTIPAANSAARLADGRILAASSSHRRIFQVDDRSKVIWKKPIEGRPMRVRR